MLTELKGCEILKRVFEARGYAIHENVDFSEEDVSFNADGWDPAARVGYEFMTAEDDDHDDLSAAELASLVRWMEEGRLYFFVIDETSVVDEAELAWAANAFLDEVDRRRKGAAS